MPSNDTERNFAKPIVLIFGMSGVGKSTLGRLLAKEWSFLHIEQDIPDANGLELWDLNNEFIEYYQALKTDKFVRKIKQLVQNRERRGAIITFDSTFTPSIWQLETAVKSGMQALVLDGPSNLCCQSYFRREKTLGHDVTESDWHEYNDELLSTFSQKAYSPYKLSVFEDQIRKPNNELLEEIATAILE